MSEIDDIRELVEQEERDEELNREAEDLLDLDRERLDEHDGYGDGLPWGYGY